MKKLILKYNTGKKFIVRDLSNLYPDTIPFAYGLDFSNFNSSAFRNKVRLERLRQYRLALRFDDNIRNRNLTDDQLIAYYERPLSEHNLERLKLIQTYKTIKSVNPRATDEQIYNTYRMNKAAEDTKNTLIADGLGGLNYITLSNYWKPLQRTWNGLYDNALDFVADVGKGEGTGNEYFDTAIDTTQALLMDGLSGGSLTPEVVPMILAKKELRKLAQKAGKQLVKKAGEEAVEKTGKVLAAKLIVKKAGSKAKEKVKTAIQNNPKNMKRATTYGVNEGVTAVNENLPEVTHPYIKWSGKGVKYAWNKDLNRWNWTYKVDKSGLGRTFSKLIGQALLYI